MQNLNQLDLTKIVEKIKIVLDKLYSEEPSLFYRNNGRATCERSLVFRFALYLQEYFSEYFVDCDYNSSFWQYYNGVNLLSGENSAKYIKNPDGSFTSRFIDIIVHKRTASQSNNFICLEIKKWNAGKTSKDINNLEVLTGNEFNYKAGFHIVLGKTLEQTKIRIFQRGREIKLETF